MRMEAFRYTKPATASRSREGMERPEKRLWLTSLIFRTKPYSRLPDSQGRS